MLKESGKRKTNVLPGYKGGTSFWNKIRSVGAGIIPNIGNIAVLGNAYMSAAQRDARAAGGIRAPKSFVVNPYEQSAL